MQPIGNTTTDSHSSIDGLANKLDQAANSIHHAGDRAIDSARPILDGLAASAHSAVERMACAAGDAADTLGIKSSQYKVMHSRLTQQVRDKPMTAVGIAVATGFLLSWLIKQR